MILSDVTKLFDCPHSTAPDEGEGYPLIRTPNIGKGRLILDDVHRVSKAVYDNRNKRAIPQTDDIIFAREAPAGNAAVITAGQKVCLGQRTVLLRPNKDLVDARYLVYFLLAPKQQIKLLGLSHGATVGHVNIPDLAKLHIELPEIHVQKKIAYIIEQYDNLIEVNNKRIKVLEQMAENLYKEWFVRFRFPGHETAEFENGMPKEWEVGTADSFFDISIGKTPPRKEFEWFTKNDPLAVNWVSISDMKDVFILQTAEQLTREAISRFNIIVVPENTILLSFKLTIGRVSITQEPCATNEAIAHFKGVNENYREFLYFQLKNYDYSKLGNTSSIGNAVNSKVVKNMKIMYPDEKIIDRFHMVSKNFIDAMLRIRRINDTLIKQRDLLLPRLMSGKLEVS